MGEQFMEWQGTDRDVGQLGRSWPAAALLTKKAIVAVPFECGRGWSSASAQWWTDLCSIKIIIRLPIFEVGPQPLAHNKPAIKGYRDISSIKEAVDIG